MHQPWWDWFADHIDRGEAGRIGELYQFGGRSAERIRQFCRPPRSEDPDHNTGEASPPEIYEALYVAMFARNPVNAMLMHDRLDARIREIESAHDEEYPSNVAQLSKQCHEGVDAVLAGHPVETQRRELLEAKAEINRKLRELFKRAS